MDPLVFPGPTFSTERLFSPTPHGQVHRYVHTSWSQNMGVHTVQGSRSRPPHTPPCWLRSRGLAGAGA